MSETDCRTCRNYREQLWDDFCYRKGHKIVFPDRMGVKDTIPREQKKRGLAVMTKGEGVRKQNDVYAVSEVYWRLTRGQD